MTIATRLANLEALRSTLTTPAAVMAAPPTITGGTTPPAWGTLYGMAHLAKYTFYGAQWSTPAQTYPGSEFTAPFTAHEGNGTDPTANPISSDGPRIRFSVTSSRIAICHGAGPSHRGLRIKVDGEYAHDGIVGVIGGFETFYYTTLTFSGSAARNYEIEFPAGGGFSGVRAESAPSAWPLTPNKLRVMLHADSMGSTLDAAESAAIDASTLGSMGSALAEYLGQPDCFNVSVGGTGFYADASGAKCTFGERAATDVIPLAPDVIVEIGGLNDGAASYEVLLGLVTDWLDAVITALPDVLIFMTGPLVSYAAGNADSNVIKVRNAKQAAAALYPQNVYFIDNVDEEWANADNEDLLLGSDPPHLALYGHNFFAERIANEIRDASPAFMTQINGWEDVPPASGSWSIQINSDGTWTPL